MKIYLSGKITGDANYRQKFGSMEKELLFYEEAKRLGVRILTEEDNLLEVFESFESELSLTRK